MLVVHELSISTIEKPLTNCRCFNSLAPILVSDFLFLLLIFFLSPPPLFIHRSTYYRAMSSEDGPVPIRDRAPSRLDLFDNNLKLDIRAHQRTYEGAYTRTSIGCLSFSILIIKIFSKEFLPIGTIYTVYGCVLYFIGVYKSNSVDVFYNPQKNMEMYKTGGNFVLLLTIISLSCYIALLVLILRM